MNFESTEFRAIGGDAERVSVGIRRIYSIFFPRVPRKIFMLANIIILWIFVYTR